jgi:zinc transport system permease protein
MRENEMLDLLGFGFFRHALLITAILGIIFGVLSFFVVLRKMAFLGAGISHMAFGGVALGILLGIHPFFSSMVFCMISALIISRIARTERISYDSGIGIFFSFAMALGVVFLAVKKAYNFDLSGYLFGNILGVTNTDLWMISIYSLLFIPFIILYFQKLLFFTFDEQVAKISGIAVMWLDIALLVLLAAIIVASMKVVGIILVTALTVLPASFGMLFTSQYKKVILISIAYCLFIMVGGLYLSYVLNSPAGATIVVSGTVIYFLALVIVHAKARSH